MRFTTRWFVAAIIAASILSFTTASRLVPARDRSLPTLSTADWARLPLGFEPNVGQTDARVRYLSRGPGYTLFVTDAELVLSVARGPAAQTTRGGDPGMRPVRIRLAGARQAPRISHGDELPGRSHYFLGADPARWRSDVPSYERVTLEQIYDGVDLVLHGSQQRLEYDFVLARGADYRQIALTIEGADSVTLADGNLVLRTGGVDVLQHKPVVYQEANGSREIVDSEYVIGEDGNVRFAVGAYDATRPLVIDPVVELAFSSFLGGLASEIAFNGGVAADADGNVYVAGDTQSADFPLDNAIQGDQPGMDLFVTKVAADGSGRIYSTYLGGRFGDEAHDVAVDDQGQLWIVGFSQSTDNPATPINEGFPLVNAFQPLFGGGHGGPGDAIVVKLNAAGDALLFSSYLGGNGLERAHAMTLDSTGDAYITGMTTSTIEMASPGMFQSQLAGHADAFVAKITSLGMRDRVTYLGGRQGSDHGYGIAVDKDGCVYVTGSTKSFDTASTPINEGFPLVNAFQPTFGGQTDAFVTKLSPDFMTAVYSTYLGGNDFENDGAILPNGRAGGIAVDDAGRAWVSGHTASANFPTVNRLRAKSANYDLFITQLASDGTSLLFSTFYGGDGIELAGDLTMDARGTVYIAGLASGGFPAVNGLPANPTINVNTGRDNDAVVIKLLPSRVIEFATYLGGHRGDYAVSVAADDSGAAYVLGGTYSTNFPLQAAFQTTCRGCSVNPGGANDAFVAKLFVPNTPPVATADLYAMVEDGALSVLAPGVLENDSDVDGNPLTAVLVNGPPSGAFALNPDGSFQYTPLANVNGPVSFSYRADDGRSLGNVVDVTVAITPINDPPTADAESLTVEQEEPTPILLMGGDIDGHPLTFTITDPPDHGTLTGGPRDMIYTGHGGYAGPDRFTFMVSDGTAAASADVSLTVTGASVAPGYAMRTHARDVSAMAQTGGESLAADFASGSLYAKSRGFPCGCPIELTEVTPAGGKRLVARIDAMQNSPGAGIALDPFMPGGILVTNENFRVSPRISRVEIATAVETTVLASPWVINPLGNGRGAQQFATDPANPHLLYFWDTTTSRLYRLNRATNALDEMIALDQARPAGDHETNSNDIVFDPITGTILLSDHPSRSILEIDPRSTPPIVSTVYDNLPASPGPIALDVQARRLYVWLGAVYAGPRRGGVLSLVAGNLGLFDMTIGRASSGVGRSLYAIDFFRDKIFEIRSLNTPPVATEDTASTDEDVAIELMPLANDTDANGDALSLTIVDPPPNGTVEVRAGGGVLYTPNANWFGTDVFSYRASDGEFDSETATVTVTVNAVNDLPTADAAGPYAVNEGASVQLTGSGADVESATLSFDWDLDGDGVFETAGQTATFSAASIGGPATRTISLRVTDGDGGTATDLAFVNIENVAPAAQPDSYAVDEDGVLTVAATGVLGNDQDIDPLIATLVTPPTNGTLTLNSDGSFSYQPAANFNGTDSFAYKANDGIVDSNSATVSLTVNAVNDPPVAVDDAITVFRRGGPWPLLVLANDLTGPDTGEILSIIGVTQPANGSVAIAPDRQSLFYTNDRRFVGVDRFTYTIGDGNGGADIAEVIVTVERGRPEADLRLTMADAPDPVRAKQPLTYTLRVRNHGPADATEVVLTDNLSRTLVFSSVSSTHGACVGGQSVRCTLGDLADGEEATVTLVVRPTQFAPTTRVESNDARVDATEHDPDPANNRARETTTIQPAVTSLQVAVTGTPNPVRVGGQLTHTINVDNLGPIEATNVAGFHLIMGVVRVTSVTASQGSCNPLSPTPNPSPMRFIMCTLGALPPGGRATVNVVVTPLQFGVIRANTTVHSPEASRGLGAISSSTVTRVR